METFMAIHAPITGARTRAPAFPKSLHQRETIETRIEQHLHCVEALLARLDSVDALHEDLEDDDSDQGIEDQPHDDLDGDREPGGWPEGWQGVGQGYADDEYEEDAADRALRKPYRDMIRRRRCDLITRNGRPWVEATGRSYAFRAGHGYQRSPVALGVASDLMA
jgi:hypothetical protein